MESGSHGSQVTSRVAVLFIFPQAFISSSYVANVQQKGSDICHTQTYMKKPETPRLKLSATTCRQDWHFSELRLLLRWPQEPYGWLGLRCSVVARTTGTRPAVSAVSAAAAAATVVDAVAPLAPAA